DGLIFSERAGADDFAGRKRHRGLVARRPDLRQTQRWTAEDVLAPALGRELAVLLQLHRESGERVDDRGDLLGYDHSRLADDQPGVQAVRSKKICGLKLPVRVDAVNHLETEREPFDGLEGGRGIAARQRPLQLEYDLRLDPRRHHPFDVYI